MARQWMWRSKPMPNRIKAFQKFVLDETGVPIYRTEAAALLSLERRLPDLAALLVKFTKNERTSA